MTDAPARVVRGYTIDPPGAFDKDDAIWLMDEPGVFRVAVANVPDIVPQGVEADQVARQRMFTRYGIDRRDSLFPFAVEKAASLLPGQKRSAIVLTMRLDDALEVAGAHVEIAPFRGEELSYPEAGDLIRRQANPRLATLYATARRLLEKRRAAGALVMYDVIRGYAISDEGRLVNIPMGAAAEAHILVQEFMILANATMARLAVANNVPVIFRAQRASTLVGDRGGLLDEINAAAVADDTHRLITLGKRLDHLVGRAYFTSFAEAHWSLNVPFYGPWTSPIRRWIDVVNWRNFLAFVRNEPFPYDQHECAVIADEATRAQDHAHDVRSSEIRGRLELMSSRAGQAFSAEQIARLVDHEFDRIVRVAPDNDPSDAVLDAVVARARDGQLPVRSAISVLLTRPAAWQRARDGVLDALQEHGPQVISILSAAPGFVQSERPEYEGRQEGPPHDPTMTCVGRVKYRGKTLEATGIAGTAKTAQQNAALGLLRQMAGADEQRVVVATKRAAVPAATAPKRKEKVVDFQSVEPYIRAGNHVSALFELCAKGGLTPPGYGYEQEGPPHAPTVTCRASLRYQGERLEVEVQSNSNKTAKNAAAEQLLDLLRNKVGSVQAPT